jgi:hypothetical protein
VNSRREKTEECREGKVEFFISAVTVYEHGRRFMVVYVKHATGMHIVT